MPARRADIVLQIHGKPDREVQLQVWLVEKAKSQLCLQVLNASKTEQYLMAAMR